MAQKIELAELIAQLREQLSSAMRDGVESELRFEPSSIELELTIGVEKGVAPDAKLKLFVFDVGTTTNLKSVTTQRLKLILEPRLSSSPDSRPLIAGKSLPGER